jgi:hypothetical protein
MGYDRRVDSLDAGGLWDYARRCDGREVGSSDTKGTGVLDGSIGRTDRVHRLPGGRSG